MKKLTQEQLEDIKKRRAAGESAYKLAEEYHVAQSTICYHTDDKKKKRDKYDSRKEYLKAYQKRRYHEDEDWRTKHIQRVKDCKKKNVMMQLRNKTRGSEKWLKQYLCIL